jgi:uncharacterized coiled-coil DUF342 family protein
VRIIRNNKAVEADKDKFAQKGQELENKITSEKEAREAANRQVEKLNSQLNKLMQEKQGLDKRARKLDEKVIRLEAERDSPSEEKESLEQKLEGKINRIAELCRMVNKLEKIINVPYKQEKKLHYKRLIKKLCYKQMEKLHYKQIKELNYKISHLRKQLQEETDNLAEKEKCIIELEKPSELQPYLQHPDGGNGTNL